MRVAVTCPAPPWMDSSTRRRSLGPQAWYGRSGRATGGARRRRSSLQRASFGAQEGELLLLVADLPEVANSVLGQLRLDLAERFDLVAEQERFAWIVDWPMFGWNAEESRWDPLHHPFTAPRGEFDSDRAGEARAAAYDIVWNGQEL